PPPGPVESPPPVEAPAPPPLAAEVHPQSAIIGGNVGVVGSAVEKNQIARIAGRSDTSTVLLLGPLLRGSTVQISPVTEEGR
ncbi:hypothetical protein B8W67_04665, partial [Mycolicibacillus koreensis]